MQTIDSADRFWEILSDKPFDEVQGDPETLNRLHHASFFKPNRDVCRVVTIGTPHRGSDYANNTTRWLSRKLIRLPSMMVSMGQQLIRMNPGVFRNTDLLTSATSIDSLSPDSPVFQAMLQAPRAPWVEYHNVIGLMSNNGWMKSGEPTSDGVVDYSSAHMDDVVSEIAVDSEHTEIHRHPKAILEVRRILLSHLDAVRAEYRVAQRLARNEAPVPLSVPIRTGNAQNGVALDQPLTPGATAEIHSGTHGLEPNLGQGEQQIPTSQSTPARQVAFP